ncbi:DUF3157 family protein [Nitrosophilus alvini]|uniref:DUF3157 family protein n=1 Tax=Nitrosophilus alvini TaxID=2714855 RepID=UPI00190A0CA1|nr:DUF3157 family protein [Nitrosophilus alvini]
MLKKLSFIMAAFMFAYAAEYITLENGKTVLLKDDGTWEEVTVIKKGNKTIALKKDGTWEEVAAKDIETANTLTNKTSEKYKDSRFAKALLGEWESDDGSVKYIFDKDKAIFKRDKETVEGKWSVEYLDEKSGKVIVNIGEGARLGFISFGGISRNLRFSPDMNTLYDESEKMEKMVDVKLHRVR